MSPGCRSQARRQTACSSAKARRPRHRRRRRRRAHSLCTSSFGHCMRGLGRGTTSRPPAARSSETRLQNRTSGRRRSPGRWCGCSLCMGASINLYEVEATRAIEFPLCVSGGGCLWTPRHTHRAVPVNCMGSYIASGLRVRTSARGKTRRQPVYSLRVTTSGQCLTSRLFMSTQHQPFARPASHLASSMRV